MSDEPQFEQPTDSDGINQVFEAKLLEIEQKVAALNQALEANNTAFRDILTKIGGLRSALVKNDPPNPVTK